MIRILHYFPGIDVSIRHKEGPDAIVTRENGQITFYTIHERNRRCGASERKHNPSCVWGQSQQNICLDLIFDKHYTKTSSSISVK